MIPTETAECLRETALRAAQITAGGRDSERGSKSVDAIAKKDGMACLSPRLHLSVRCQALRRGAAWIQRKMFVGYQQQTS